MIWFSRLEGLGKVARSLIYISMAWWLYSCVPNKRLVYLQHDDDLVVVQPKDSILRSYEIRRKSYRLKPEDIISLRIASVTDPEFNFINNYELQLGSIKELSQYSKGLSGGSDQQRGGNNNNIGGMGGATGASGGLTMLLERLDGGFKIDSEGRLDLPQVGNIKLSGLTITEAEELVRDSLSGYYEIPMVRIQLLNFNYSIIGEVEEEGRYITYDPEINIFDAIILAGNLTEVADRSNIKIVRQQDGQNKVLYLDALDEDLLGKESFYIQPNDLIIVPPLKARTAQQYTLPRTTTALGILSSSISLILLIITLSN